MDQILRDSLLIIQDEKSSIYLQNLDLTSVEGLIRLTDDSQMATLKTCRKWCILVHSNLSSISFQLISFLSAALAQGALESVEELHVINTHLNEHSHIEQLEWHPEWQGVWSSTASVVDDNHPDKASSAGSISPSFSLGYFDAIARRLGAVLRNRVVVNVAHISNSSVWLTNNTFALDSHIDLFPDISPPPLNHSKIDEKNSILPETQDFASVLSSFLDHINFKDTLFTVGRFCAHYSDVLSSTQGPLSNEIGKSLAEQAKDAPRQSSSTSTPAAVIIVDRTLDLAPPAMASDNPMDLIYDCFPRSKSHGIDCLMDPVNLGISADNNVTEKDDTDSWLPIVNGRLDPELNGLFQSLFNKTERQVIETIKNFLTDFISRKIKPTPDEIYQAPANIEGLESMIQFLKSKPRLLYEFEEHIVFLVAIVKAVSFNLATRMELLSAEKVILALFAQTMDTSHIFYQLYDLLAKITKEKQSGASTSQSITTRDVLLLTLHMYSIIGTSAIIEPQNEVYLQKGFVQAMMASNPKANIRAVTMWVQRVFIQLSKVSRTRSGLASPQLRNLINFDSVYPFTPFLVKMAQDLLSIPQTSINPDIVHIPYRKAMTKVLSGFSMLMGGGGLSPHPSSFSVVVLFVVGGISFKEASILQDMYREKGIKLIVGSNTICNRDSIMQHIFKSK